MSSYDQGRMDAWERIDAIKRRLGLAGFFNEQKIKRYPKGHPKAGEFMPKPKEGKKPVAARRVFNLNLSPVETQIDGNKFSLRFKNEGKAIDIDFLANDSYDMQDLPDSTKRKAAFWWRRNAVNTAKMMPDGVPLRAAAYDMDGKGQDRIAFYKALGFHDNGKNQVSAITRGGKITPETASQARGRRQVEIRTTDGGKPKKAYSQQDYDRDLDNIFGDPRTADQIFDEDPDELLPEVRQRISRERASSGQQRSIMDIAREDDVVFDFADDDDDDDDWYNRAVERDNNSRRRS